MALLLLITLAVSIASAQESSTTTSCTKVASPSGNDSNSGSSSSPYKTAQKLLSSLSAGQVGCLTSGATFVQDVAKVNGTGTSSAPITITSTGSTPATLRGRLYIPTGANYITVTNLILDGRNSDNLPSPAVNGDYAVFRYDEVTNYHTAICFQLGNPGWGTTHGTIIDSSRIHDCGTLPATNHEHGFYVELAVSTQITNNYIYKNADRGVQLYPSAQSTQVTNNVIDSNGEGVIFSGDSGNASSNNYVARNIISNSNIRYNAESWWPGPVGTGNVLENNCVWHGAAGDIQTPQGFTARNNTTADPGYVNASSGDYRLKSGSACAGMGPTVSQIGTGVLSVSQSTTPPPTTPPPTTPPPAATGSTGSFTVSSSLPSTISGSVQWTATTSASSVSSVMFSIDGVSKWTEHVTPYVFNGDKGLLNTTTLSNGPHTFLVTVASGSQTATKSFQSTVSNGASSPAPTPAPAPSGGSSPPPPPPPPPPAALSVSSSLPGAISGSVIWTATVNNVPAASVSTVVFMIDNKSLWTEHLAPYVFNGNSGKLDTRTLSNGTHTFAVVVNTTDGRTATTSFQAKAAN